MGPRVDSFSLIRVRMAFGKDNLCVGSGVWNCKNQKLTQYEDDHRYHFVKWAFHEIMQSHMERLRMKTFIDTDTKIHRHRDKYSDWLPAWPDIQGWLVITVGSPETTKMRLVTPPLPRNLEDMSPYFWSLAGLGRNKPAHLLRVHFFTGILISENVDRICSTFVSMSPNQGSLQKGIGCWNIKEYQDISV